MSEDLAKRVKQYVQVRDVLKRLEDEYNKKRAPLLEVQSLLSGILEHALDQNNAENVKTEHGTFYRSTRYTANLADPDAFMQYVIDNNKFELLDRRANATAVRAFAEKEKSLPPGCNLNAIRTVGVRRSPGANPQENPDGSGTDNPG